MNRQQLELALQNPNMQKFLTYLSMSEGSAPFKDPYLAKGGTRGELLPTGYTNHPAMLGDAGNWYFTNKDGQRLLSTASGRYAIKKSTWEGVNKALGGNLTFSPKDQDLAAAYLISGRGALDDVLNGNIKTAIQKLGKEWSSLPTAPDSYKQFKHQWDRTYGMLAKAGFDPKALGSDGNYTPYKEFKYDTPTRPYDAAKAAGELSNNALESLYGGVQQNDTGLGRRSPIDIMAGEYVNRGISDWRRKSIIDSLSGF